LQIEKKVKVDKRLEKMIEELGLEFQNFIKQNSIALPRVITAELNPIFHSITNHLPSLHQIPKGLSPSKNIFELCEKHPKMGDCICAAFPFAYVCKKDYCLNNPNYYECDPNYCNLYPKDKEACKCKFHPLDTSCKCKLNPIRKECFCLSYPSSLYCLPDFCKNDNYRNEIYCLCSRNPFAPECKPAYCRDSKNDYRCKCLLQPDDESCKCLMKGEKNCKTNKPYKEEKKLAKLTNNREKIVIKESKGNLVKKKTVGRNNSGENKNDSHNTNGHCQPDDIFCTCKNHPIYEKCVCLIYPSANICLPSYCDNEINKFDYECNPNKNCEDPEMPGHKERCQCKLNFDDNKCRCKLFPFTKECFCNKFKSSHLCNIKNCDIEKKNIFCNIEIGNKLIGKSDKLNKFDPNYCAHNKENPECKCLVNPYQNYCLCLNNPILCSSNFIY
jgi:hypothetical protein